MDACKTGSPWIVFAFKLGLGWKDCCDHFMFLFFCPYTFFFCKESTLLKPCHELTGKIRFLEQQADQQPSEVKSGRCSWFRVVPGEECPLSIFSCRFVASPCVSHAERSQARCPCCRAVPSAAGLLVSYSYLVLKHQMLAYLCPSCFYDFRPLWSAEGGCDWT